jgi:peroxiredoxin
VNYVPDLSALPAGLPRPFDDGGAAHLAGLPVPHIAFPSTAGVLVSPSEFESTTVLYLYPMTGRPGVALPNGWDSIPGARGCTPEACGFRDHYSDLKAAGATVYGLSSQPSDEQKEAAARLRLPFPLLSDERLRMADALRLPTLEVDGRRLFKRLTLIVRRASIEHVFYPVFPPDQHAREVLDWLQERASS